MNGFSKLLKEDKLEWMARNFFHNPEEVVDHFKKLWHEDTHLQRLFDEVSENTITNFFMPYGVVPNFLVNGKMYCIPMVTEESSVVAATGNSAKFWLSRGGFQAEVISTIKVGQIHFIWPGEFTKLQKYMPILKEKLLKCSREYSTRMEKRGGGITALELLDFSHEEKNLFQMKVSFETVDAMGANFINTILERWVQILKYEVEHSDYFSETEKNLDVIMAIVSNYTPECIVKSSVSIPIEKMAPLSPNITPEEFAEKFRLAMKISKIDPSRAVTHNKGIFNGIDALAMATGNDFRAIEACGHAYAARDGQYRGLSDFSMEDGLFNFSLKIPLAVGSVGGLTKVHPLARLSLEMLGNPNAKELMGLVAVVGLAQNFGAIKSLITTGIQRGHMKLHLNNILNQLGATAREKQMAQEHLNLSNISFTLVENFLETIRKVQ